MNKFILTKKSCCENFWFRELRNCE